LQLTRLFYNYNELPRFWVLLGSTQTLTYKNTRVTRKHGCHQHL